MTDGAAETRVIFALDDWEYVTHSTSVLYRSSDGGVTWHDVFTLPAPISPARQGPRDLVVSPQFATDGLALLVADGLLYRSQDHGATWQPLPPAIGQRVQQAIFSPSFANDGTVFVAAVSNDVPPLYQPGNVDAPLPTDHERSVGVLKSVDRGFSWQQMTSGMEVDGVPYRQVRTMAISPTFGNDGVVFAYAWGPWEDVEVGNHSGGTQNGQPIVKRAVHTALFRSTDGGETWSPVLLPDWKPWQAGVSASPAYYVRISLSRAFVSDGLALMALNAYGMGARSGWCDIHITADRGATWEHVDTPGLEQARPCFQILTGNHGGGLVALAEQCRLSVECRLVWSRSLDGGRSWQRLKLPGALANGSTDQRVAGDGTVFFAGQDGIWRLGPD